MLLQIYSIILENMFAALLFISFMIYYANIPFSLYSVIFIFIFVFILMVTWLHNLYNLSGYMILCISSIISMCIIIMYYVVNKIFTTKYGIVVFLFPISFLVLYNVSKTVVFLLPFLTNCYM